MIVVIDAKADRVTCAHCGVIRLRAGEDAYAASQRHAEEGCAE